MSWYKCIEIINPNSFPIDRIDGKKMRLDSLRPFPNEALKRIREDICLEWTYHSNAIEGNTLNLNETRIVLKDGMTVKGKSLREHFEALNHQDAIKYLESIVQSKKQITSSELLSIHALVLQRIEKEFSGRYRNAGVRIIGANFIPPNAAKVSDLVDELIDYVTQNTKQFHPCLLATLLHHRLVWIHPFFDGNGRTARLLFNLFLMKQGYPPAIILKQDRKKYYAAMNTANQGDISSLFLLTLQAVERGLDIYLSSFNDRNDEYKNLNNLLSEANLPYSLEYISLLARTGKIAAYKDGRNWKSSEKDIQHYFQNRKRVRTQRKS